MKRILVTGGLGFIGSNFIRYISEARPDWEIWNIDKMTYAARGGDYFDGLDNYVFTKGDISVFTEYGPYDYAVNFAAESHVDRSLQDCTSFINSNYIGVKNLLEATRKGYITRLLQVSTDEVYGPAFTFHFTERDNLRPGNPYSATKAAAELLCQAYYKSFGTNVVVTRGANTVGPYQYPEKVVPLFTTNALLGLPMPLYGDGRQSRDYIHVTDHCSAILSVLERGVAGESYNVGANNYLTTEQVAGIIANELDYGSEPNCIIIPDRPGHDKRYRMETYKIQREVGWVAKKDAQTAIAETVLWYVNNPEWWQSIRNTIEFNKYFAHQYPMLVGDE